MTTVMFDALATDRRSGRHDVWPAPISQAMRQTCLQERNMKSRYGFLFYFLTAAFPVHAQSSDEVLIGPVNYHQNVNGVDVVIAAKSYINLTTINDQLSLKLRILGDLSDLQKKIGSIVDTFSLPSDNCGSYSPNNPVVSIPRKELTYRDGSAIFSLGGTVTMWGCVQNPVPNTKVEWQVRRVGLGIKTKVPVLIKWPGYPVKTILATQPFDADLPIQLVKDNDQAVGLQFSRPDIELKGQYAFITKGVLKIAGVDVNQKAYDAVRKAVDPQKLILTLPDEVRKFHPTVTSADFTQDGGHLEAEIAMSALIPAASMTDFVKAVLDKKKQ